MMVVLAEQIEAPVKRRKGSNNPTSHSQIVEEIVNGAVTRRYTLGHWIISETQNISGTWTTSFYGYDGHNSVRFLPTPPTATPAAPTPRTDLFAYPGQKCCGGQNRNGGVFEMAQVLCHNDGGPGFQGAVILHGVLKIVQRRGQSRVNQGAIYRNHMKNFADQPDAAEGRGVIGGPVQQIVKGNNAGGGYQSLDSASFSGGPECRRSRIMRFATGQHVQQDIDVHPDALAHRPYLTLNAS